MKIRTEEQRKTVNWLTLKLMNFPTFSFFFNGTKKWEGGAEAPEPTPRAVPVRTNLASQMKPRVLIRKITKD